MRATHYSALTGAFLVIVGGSLAVPRAQPPGASPGPALTVAPGFSVERVAGPPLVNRPIVADFDDEGRLYVADSSGSNEKVDKQLIDKPHRIVRLEDTDADGRFDKSIVFADKMMFPEGAMWFAGSLYVAAPPSIWKLTDTDDDGIADTREEWFQGKTLTGCANDLHGPYLGPDGWIYWTKGAFAEQTYERPGKPPLVTRASHILRRQPGDGAVDIVMTGGMDNPVDVAFTPSGERILTATFVEHPQLGRRDGLLHAIYGGVYGKQHAVIDGHKRTGDLMPVLSELGPAVPAGLTRYSSTVFGDGFRGNFFAAMFNLRKVTRHVLEPSGATFTVRDSDFLISDNRDFHPTDVIEDADGSLLVIDTGPWYKLCCPTSQLAKPDVLGGIYRVRRTGASRVADPRGLDLPWNAMTPADLAARLDDPRPAVQDRAVNTLATSGSTLATRGADAIPVLDRILRTSTSPDARRNAVWTLTRISSVSAAGMIRRAIRDRDDSVRHAAIHTAGLWRHREALPELRDALKSGTPAVQRAAAEALGRIGDGRAVADLLSAAASPHDRVLEHSITYALIEINDRAATAPSAQPAAPPRARRAALVALDQMDDGGLTADAVVTLLDSADPLLKDTAWWIAGHHPEWGDALATFFAARLSAPGVSPTERAELQQKLSQFGENPAIQELLAGLVDRADSKDERLVALRAMAAVVRTRAKVLPAGWIGPLVRGLSAPDPEIVTHVLSVIRTVPSPKDASTTLQGALLQAGRDKSRSIEIRLNALAALHDGLTVVEPDVFELLQTGLQGSQPVAIKSAAAGVIEKAAFNRSQLIALADSLPAAGALELPRVLRTFSGSTDEAVGLAMIASLQRSKSRSSVRADMLRPVLAKYPESVQKAGEALLASFSLDSANQVRRLEALLPSVQGGDVSRGQTVFNSAKAACYACHAIGYMGGKIGPDLTRIGQVRSERDLLEAILFPSASFARGYEPVVIRTRAGEVRGGVLRSNDLPDEVVLATDRDETRIARRDIVEMQPGTASLMPQGLDQQLSTQELADLLAFLKATRSGAN
jgi:putative membrane-bound dehydrogenase-like protein